ncbi:MAG: serine acetyltransferase [Chloroflexota bacterium]
MFWYRFARWGRGKGIPGIAMILYQFIYHRFGAELRMDTPVGGGLYIAHPSGVVVSPDYMGENCSIVHGVTIGLRNEYSFPKFGDRVFIGAGARVLGDIEIGDDVQIGANSVVLKDVPAGGTVVGIPGKVISIYGERIKQPEKAA